MTTRIDSAMTVGELVREQPSRSRVFEDFGIDYCCEGKRPLTEVCARSGVDADAVVDKLHALESEPGDQDDQWASMSMSELAAHIVDNHHGYLKQELPRLDGIIRKVAAVHCGRYPYLLELAQVYSRFAAELGAHMLKEEQLLFPLIRRVEKSRGGSGDVRGACIANSIQAMEHEHEDAGRVLLRMRELTNNFTPPADACNTFRAMLDGLATLERDMHQHVHKENNVLFPGAIALENPPGAKMTN